MAQPVVVKGPRGADSRGLYRKEQHLPNVEIPEVAPAREGEVIFISPHQMLRVTLWTRWDRAYLDVQGKRRPDKRDAVFYRGIYRTTDPEEIEVLRKAKSNGALFFEKSKLEEQARDAKIMAAMVAADDPEVAEALKVKLGVQEMPLPPKKEAKEGVADDSPPTVPAAVVDSESAPKKAEKKLKPI